MTIGWMYGRDHLHHHDHTVRFNALHRIYIVVALLLAPLDNLSSLTTMSLSKDSQKNEDVSPVLMISLLFVVHTVTNSVFLSPLGGDLRCLLWDKERCSKDEAWMATWFAFSHLHVATLLAGLAHASKGNPKLEATLSYIVACIIFVYMAEGIFSTDVLNPYLASVQLVVFVLFLVSIAFFTAEQDRNQRIMPLTRKFSTSSFDRRSKLSVTTVGMVAQFLGSMFRVIEMVLGGGHTGYLGDQSSPTYQNISNMAMCDMMLVAGILGVTVRFFWEEAEKQKTVLWCHVGALLVCQALLAGEPGEMIDAEQKQAGGIGTFVLILAATLGAL